MQSDHDIFSLRAKKGLWQGENFPSQGCCIKHPCVLLLPYGAKALPTGEMLP